MQEDVMDWSEMPLRMIAMAPDKGGAGGGGSAGSDGAGDAGNAGDDDAGDGEKGGDQQGWEDYLKEQPEEIQGLYEEHTKGLKSALKSERESRKGLEKQLRELAKKADDGSETEQKLTEMADQLSEAESQADFYEAAHREGVTNLKLAWVIAQQDELFDRRGNVDFAAMKEEYPELFRGSTKRRTDSDAGSGTGTKGPGKASMDDLIRGGG